MSVGDFQTEFAGRRWRLFWLSLKTSVLTVLTLGIYRFWMKTRLRRWYWSAVRPGGQPLEYVGEPLEKLLGFLIAVVIMAFYIGVVNLLLMFVSFSLLGGNFAAYAMSFVGVIPILFYARYRARRYILARTRWRGLRFGLNPGAWGYSWRALVHWGITIVTLGLFYPRQVFYLEKYRTDRTTYGSATLHQGGKWTMLYRYMWPLVISVVLGAACVGFNWIGLAEDTILLALILFVPAALVSLLRFKVHAFRMLANHKSTEGIHLHSAPRTTRVLGIYLLGYTLVTIALTIMLLPAVAVGYYIQTCILLGPDISDTCVKLLATPAWLATTSSIALYFAIFITWDVLKHVLVIMPINRHYAQTLEIRDTFGLSRIHQSERDEFTEAEGFAEALDLGAAI